MAEPLINIEETPDKIVGRRRVVTNPFSLEGNRKEDARAWQKAMPRTFIPKGVYRFRTHEEADEWEWKMIMRSRRKS
jgi:hypothetical protein